MAKTVALLLPPTAELLREFGGRLRMARRRRRVSAKQVAERAGMSPMTLRSLERGGSGVTMGAYLAVMQVLGVEDDLDLLAKADSLGRALQDARLPTASYVRRSASALPVSPAQPKRSASVDDAVAELLRLIESSPHALLRKVFAALPTEQLRKAMTALPTAPMVARSDRLAASGSDNKKQLESTGAEHDWIAKSGFASSDTLVGLIDPPARLSKTPP